MRRPRPKVKRSHGKWMEYRKAKASAGIYDQLQTLQVNMNAVPRMSHLDLIEAFHRTGMMVVREADAAGWYERKEGLGLASNAVLSYLYRTKATHDQCAQPGHTVSYFPTLASTSGLQR